MFERFTEKAVNVVCEAQRLAKELKSSEVRPEHFLLAITSEARGVSLKLFRMYNINADNMREEVKKYTENAISALEIFGDRAENLVKLAEYLIYIKK